MGAFAENIVLDSCEGLHYDEGGDGFFHLFLFLIVNQKGGILLKKQLGENEITDIGTEEFGAEIELKEPDRIYPVACPVEGRVIPLMEIPDTTFAYGMLGPGVGIIPKRGIAVAPFDGEVSALFDTKHAIGLTSDDGGVEVLIHIGINTVELKGEYITALVSAGDLVKAGQPLLKFDLDKIKEAGYNPTVAVLVSNVYLFPRIRVVGYGEKICMEELLECRK